MRLTNAMREDFLDQVMISIPFKHAMTMSAAIDEVEKRINAALPSDVKAVVKKYPGLLATATECLKDMPKADNVYRIFYLRVPRIIDLRDIEYDDVRKAVALRDQEEYIDRPALRNKLKGAAYNATTLDELKKALPELVEYMPTPVVKVKTMALAPVGLIADLKKAGLKVAKGARA